MDLECFPDGRMTKDEHIVAAARDVLATVVPARDGQEHALPLWANPLCRISINAEGIGSPPDRGSL